VLDVGTGTGVTALAVSDKLPGVGVVASDLSSGMLRHARSQPGSERVSWVTTHSAYLPFRDGVFDLVTSTFTLHHFPPPEQLAVLCELRRVTAPHGRILLADQVLPVANIDKDDMNQRVLDLFYAHLRRDVAVTRLARFGEWPLTAEDLVALASRAGLVASCHVVDPLVSVFVMCGGKSANNHRP
jgi:ubiquinone/menaquinone biosynthesis C-methylase UbiE